MHGWAARPPPSSTDQGGGKRRAISARESSPPGSLGSRALSRVGETKRQSSPPARATDRGPPARLQLAPEQFAELPQPVDLGLQRSRRVVTRPAVEGLAMPLRRLLVRLVPRGRQHNAALAAGLVHFSSPALARP
jgi:hypothetical protein